MIWDEEIASELDGLGELSRYAAGTWLQDRVKGQTVVRRILMGHVDVHAMKMSRPVLEGRYGPGDILGIRSRIYPLDEPRSRCRAVSDIECDEIPWETIEELSRKSPRLESLMRNIARMRVYGVAIAMHPAFSCLNLDERKTLFDNAIIRLLAPGEHLICKRDDKAHLYLLVSGTVDVRNNDTSIVKRSKGEILGEISLFGFSEYPTADVIAEHFSEIIEFRDADMLDVMNNNPVFKQRITALVGSRLPA